tara:strand:- start:5740 stop:6603 length:864 start_codon:yes stop_codon:yes gene_type:complete
MTNRYIHLACLAGFTLFATQGAGAAPLLPYYGTQTFNPGAPIDNPYFPMPMNVINTYEGSFEDEGEIVTEGFELSNIGPGKTLLGVQTWTQLDRAFEGELLVEETHDYYAQDTDGNVWYFGEDVVNYVYDDDDNLVSTNTSSSWLAGVNDALPGIIMLGDAVVDFNYYQEFAVADDALDHARIKSVGNTVTIGPGTFTNVIQVLEGSVLEPDFREFKYYAPGIGLILAEEGLDENLMNPELSVELVSSVPVPAALPLFVSALAGAGFLGRRRARPVIQAGVRKSGAP